MCFFDDAAPFDAYELGHCAVHHIAVVLCLPGFRIGYESEFRHFFVGNIVETEKIGARFFYRGAVYAECVGIDAGKQTPAAVSEAFVQIGV